MREPRFSVFDDGKVIFRYDNREKGTDFTVEIHCPLAVRLHEKHREIMEQHRQWARSFHLLPGDERYQRYCETRLDLISSYQLSGLSVEAAIIHSHLMTWFFVFDDIMDINHGLQGEAGAYRSYLCKRHLEILDGAKPDGGAPDCLSAFNDFLQKVNLMSGERFMYWHERMKHHLREYVQGAYWESLIGPTTGVNTNTAMYLQVRHMAVGVSPCLDLMALAAGISGKPIADNFFVQRLERLAINYSIWVNDLAGLGRDMKRGLGNVVFTLQRDHGLTLEEATRMLARLCDEEFDAFLQVESQLPMLLGSDYEKERKSIDAYVDILKRWMRGLLDWSARSDRYQRLDVNMALQDHASILKVFSKTTP